MWGLARRKKKRKAKTKRREKEKNGQRSLLANERSGISGGDMDINENEQFVGHHRNNNKSRGRRETRR